VQSRDNEFCKWDDMQVDAQASTSHLHQQKSHPKDGFFCLPTLSVTGGDGALAFFYGVTVAIERVSGKNCLA
jgi:hypothetical protein